MDEERISEQLDIMEKSLDELANHIVIMEKSLKGFLDKRKQTLEELKAKIEVLENLPDRVSTMAGNNSGKQKEITEEDFLRLMRSGD